MKCFMTKLLVNSSTCCLHWSILNDCHTTLSNHNTSIFLYITCQPPSSPFKICHLCKTACVPYLFHHMEQFLRTPGSQPLKRVQHWSLSVTERMLASHQGCHANTGTSQSGSCKQVHFYFHTDIVIERLHTFPESKQHCPVLPFSHHPSVVLIGSMVTILHKASYHHWTPPNMSLQMPTIIIIKL